MTKYKSTCKLKYIKHVVAYVIQDLIKQNAIIVRNEIKKDALPAMNKDRPTMSFLVCSGHMVVKK